MPTIIRPIQADDYAPAAALASARTEGPAHANAGGFDVRAWGTREGGRGGMNNLQPLWMLKYLPNMLACHVTIIHGCEGPSNTITCAEASGLLSIGESAPSGSRSSILVLGRAMNTVCTPWSGWSSVAEMLARFEADGRSLAEFQAALSDLVGVIDDEALREVIDRSLSYAILRGAATNAA